MSSPPTSPERPSSRRLPRPGRPPGRLPDRLSGPVVAQFVKFGIVERGEHAARVRRLYGAAEEVFGVWYLAASAIGFALGAVNGFLLNRRWTFRGHVGDALTPVRWFVVQGCGLLVEPRPASTCSSTAVGLDKLAGRRRARRGSSRCVVGTFVEGGVPHRALDALATTEARSRAEASGVPRAGRGRRGCARRGRSARPRARADVRAAS